MADEVKIRYRGYYYDTETGFYYLQSRYYDPTLCRFISPDKYTLLSTLSMSLGELNLYSYCANNPIMYTDPTGESFFIAGILIGCFVGMAASIVSQGLTSGWENINPLQVAVDGAFGALAVGLAATGIGLGASMALGGVMGVAQYGLDTAISGNQFSWSDAALATTLGVLGGVISGAGAQNVKGLAYAILRNTSVTATSVISGIQNLTNDVAFSNVVSQEFISASRKMNFMAFVNSAITTFRSFYFVD